MTLEAALQHLSDTPSHLEGLAQLIQSLRPKHLRDTQQAIVNIRALSYLLEHHESYRAALRQALLQLLKESRQLPLYTESGILANEGFASALFRRLGERLLPMPFKPDSLQDRFSRLFNWKYDYIWLDHIPQEAWHDLWKAMAWEENTNTEVWQQTQLQLLESVQVLSAQITAIGLEPELVRINPDIERFESPFLTLGAEVQRFVDNYRQSLMQILHRTEDDKHILVLLEQCEAILNKVRKNAKRFGISINLTYHCQRLTQSITRLRALLSLLDTQDDPHYVPKQIFILLVSFAKAENRKYSIRDLFKSNIELLALQVTEHAGRHGEHYIAETRQELSHMAKAAMGAGFIVAFMALIKIYLEKAELPLLLEGIAFGLNYAIGFIIIQILHFTIATKQPAMTAASIAAALHASTGHKQETLDNLVELIVKVIRTQVTTILGNVLLAFPTAYLIAWLWRLAFGIPLINHEQAEHVLQAHDPLHSLLVFHAAIAGVFLFLSGLIAGYYDNKAIYRRIPERLASHPTLKKWLGEHRTWKLAHYIEHNLGALAGNFYFGLFLGLTGTIGLLLGLPLGIRHITFSSTYVAFSTESLGWLLSPSTIAITIVGIVLIGIINLAVSFSLALWVALRSRKLTVSLLLPLAPLLIKRFIRHPWSFFVPVSKKNDSPPESP